MATLPQLSGDMSAAQFAEQANTNFSTVMTAAENAGSSSGGGGETSDIQRTIKMQMQGGRLVNGWQNTTRGDDNFFKYLHTTLMLSVENSALVGVTTDSGETLTIFCYAGNGSYLGSTGSVSTLSNGTCFVRFMLSKSSAYSNVKMLEVTIKGFPKFVKNDVYSRVSVNEFMFETVFPKNYEPTKEEASTSGNAARSYMGTGNTRYYDWGFINLPPNYTIDGKPVPLVVYVHGTGGYAWSGPTSNNGGGDYRQLQNFIVNNGYALCDCTGLTNNHADGNQNAFESPSFISSICNIVKYLTTNYNICDDGVYVYGKSSAGFTVHLLAIQQPFKIKAVGSLAPALSPMISTPLHCDNGSVCVNAILEQLEIDGTVDSNFRNDSSKWHLVIGRQYVQSTPPQGSNPKVLGYFELSNGQYVPTQDTSRVNNKTYYLHDYTNLLKWRRIDPFFANTDLSDDEVFALVNNTYGFVYHNSAGTYRAPWDMFLDDGFYNETTQQEDSSMNLRYMNLEIIGSHKRWCSVPTKIWIEPLDASVSYQMSKVFVDMAKETGSPCYLRTMPQGTGGHHAVDTADSAIKVDYKTKFAGIVNVPIAYAELVDWFNRW